MTPVLSLSEQVARKALEHYELVLPNNKGKPRDTEWTVYCALLAVVVAGRNTDGRMTTTLRNHDKIVRDIQVVCCATGTKCTAERNDHGYILHDSHAEVLVRRGLLRVLWKEIADKRQLRRSTNNPPHESSHSVGELPQTFSLLEACENNEDEEDFSLRSDVELHLYISDSPCGDASIYPIEQLENSNREVKFTGAKLIVSHANGEIDSSVVPDSNFQTVGSKLLRQPPNNGMKEEVVVAREDVQLLGKLRTKSGRSNLLESQRSSSMSCSDKLVMWSVIGWQGAALSRYIVHPIRISHIVVSHDERASLHDKQASWDDQNSLVQHVALKRAIPDRVMAVKHELSRRELTLASSRTPDGCTDSKNEACSCSGKGEENMLAAFASELHPPEVSIVKSLFARGKASAEASSSHKRKRDADTETQKIHCPTKLSPCGMSINWQIGDTPCTMELTIGTRGIRHGKKPKCEKDYIRLKSRLCRAALIEAAKTTLNATATSKRNVAMKETATCFAKKKYSLWKHEQASPMFALVKKNVLQRGLLSGWLVGGGDFILDDDHNPKER